LFPASTYLAEPRKKVSIFEDDLKTLKMMQQPYEDISDVIRRLIMERK
jgi:predicted CopG family antitoxin